jgi:hypothetical protein
MENRYPDLLSDPAWVKWFWRRVDRRGGSDACWPWRKSLDRDGYGQVAVGLGVGRIKRAHRIAYELTHGAVPPLLDHFKCYNRKCCNPEHLRPATIQTNNKNRKPRAYRKHVSTETETYEVKGQTFLRVTQIYRLVKPSL